jgi:DNA-binding protein HU-beta
MVVQLSWPPGGSRGGWKEWWVNRGELVNAVVEATSLPRAQVEATVVAVLEQIMGATVAGEKVTLLGFGTFEARARAARAGVNPATGAPLQIAASRGVGFKVGATFKQKVAGTTTGGTKGDAAAKKVAPAAKKTAAKKTAAKKTAPAAKKASATK